MGEFDVKCDSGCGYWRGRCGQPCCLPKEVEVKNVDSKGEEDKEVNVTWSNASGNSSTEDDGQASVAKSTDNESISLNLTNNTAQNQSKLQSAFEVSSSFGSSEHAIGMKDSGLGVIDWVCLFGVGLLVAAFHRCTHLR